MEQATHQTASSSEESAAAAEELTAQSAALMEVVERLGFMAGVVASRTKRRADSPIRRSAPPELPQTLSHKPWILSASTSTPAGSNSHSFSERDFSEMS
jgi:hypothetical protein